MAGINDVLIDPKTFFFQSPVSLDPTTIVERPPQFEKGKVQKMLVANGSVIQVYDVSDPENPVLLSTIG